LVDEEVWQPPGKMLPSYLFSLFGTFPLRSEYEQIATEFGVKIRPDLHTSDRVALIYADDKEKGVAAMNQL